MSSYTLDEGIEVIEDNATVQAVLVQHNRFCREVPDCNRSFAFWATQTHAYAAVHFYGHASEIDNGYTLTVFDLGKVSKERIAFIMALLTEHGRDESGPMYSGFIENKPQTN